MNRRLLSVCAGAALVGASILTNQTVAKPPGLPEDGSFTAVPAAPHFTQLFHFWRSARSQPEPTRHPECTFRNILWNMPKRMDCAAFSGGRNSVIEAIDWGEWLLSLFTAREQSATRNQTEECTLYFEPQKHISDLAPAGAPTHDLNIPVMVVVEAVPMPHEEETTCPYLRQQKMDRPAGQRTDIGIGWRVLDNLKSVEDADQLLDLAKALEREGHLEKSMECCNRAAIEIGRSVLDNLKRLEEADKLIDLAKALASEGYFEEAMECCDRAAGLCPGSSCSERAVTTMIDLAFSSVPMPSESEEAAEPEKETLVSEMMQACHALMKMGMQHQAAEVARQAFSLDPQRVLADPLIYKMHLLVETPVAKTTGASEESEPQTCPYCPNAGKPIRELVPGKIRDARKLKP